MAHNLWALERSSVIEVHESRKSEFRDCLEDSVPVSSISMWLFSVEKNHSSECQIQCYYNYCRPGLGIDKTFRNFSNTTFELNLIFYFCEFVKFNSYSARQTFDFGVTETWMFLLTFVFGNRFWCRVIWLIRTCRASRLGGRSRRPLSLRICSRAP